MLSDSQAPADPAAQRASSAVAFAQRYAAEADVPVSAVALFPHLDDHARLSSHMSRASGMMLGSHMELSLGADEGRAVGARIRLSGRVLGFPLLVEEEVTERAPPRRKVWETLGSPRLLVIGPYRMGFEITPTSPERSRLRVFIEFALPERRPWRWIGQLLGPWYARWCVDRMLRDASAPEAA